MDLRTRYTALVTLTTQHVKYISDALRRLEEEEVCYGFLSLLRLAFIFTYCIFAHINTYKYAHNEDNIKFHQLMYGKWKRFPFAVQKEVEEERQARVGQVSEMLGWVKGLQERAGRSAEPSLAAQQVRLEC